LNSFPAAEPCTKWGIPCPYFGSTDFIGHFHGAPAAPNPPIATRLMHRNPGTQKSR
jgi:hypothetical protein